MWIEKNIDVQKDLGVCMYWNVYILHLEGVYKYPFMSYVDNFLIHMLKNVRSVTITSRCNFIYNKMFIIMKLL